MQLLHILDIHYPAYLTATQKTSIENIGYLFDGYDILFGSPLDAGTESGIAGPDPGFRQTIWEADYSDCLRSEDQNIAIPRGLTVTSCADSCKISFTSKVINGTKQFRDVMDNKVCIAAILGSSSTCGRSDNRNNEDDGDGDREKRSVGRSLIRRKRFIANLFRNIFGKITGRSGGKSRSRKNSRSRDSKRSGSRGRSRGSRGSGSRSGGSKRSKSKQGASRGESEIFGSKSGGSSGGGHFWETLGIAGIFGDMGGDDGDGEDGESGTRFQVNFHSIFQ